MQWYYRIYNTFIYSLLSGYAKVFARHAEIPRYFIFIPCVIPCI